MRIINDADYISKEFDFTDSIVTSVKWDENMLDLVLEVDYFWYKETLDTKTDSIRFLKIRFINCSWAEFNMPKSMGNVEASEYSNYVWSWYNIVHFLIGKSINGNVNIEIKTVDEQPKWLSLECEKIQIEF